MQTYSIALCDDDESARRELSELCRDILAELNIENSITAFDSAERLREALNGTRFDLLILDIQMKGMTGMELARELRRNNDRVSVIFISACDEYLREGYEVQPVHFLLKPVDRDALAGALRLDWRLNHSPRAISLCIGGRSIGLVLSDVDYIESLNHRIIVHTASGSAEYYSSLSKLEKQLPSGNFARCHNSFLVNLDRVREIRRTEIMLKNGALLPVGRTYYKSFQSAFITFING